MKKVLGCFAVLAALGAAAPAFASDVSGDRHAPSARADAARRTPAATTERPAPAASARGDEAPRPAAPCACCAKGGGHAQAARDGGER